MLQVTDADIFLTNLDSTLFPGIDSSIEVHSGFKDAQAASVSTGVTIHNTTNNLTSAATDVLAAVQSSMSKNGATAVSIVGHSLGCYYLLSILLNFAANCFILTGAAIALLDSVYLPL